MSLVNDMLRDLDRRKHQPVSVPLDNHANTEVDGGRRSRLWLFLSGIAALLLVLGGGYYLLSGEGSGDRGQAQLLEGGVGGEGGEATASVDTGAASVTDPGSRTTGDSDSLNRASVEDNVRTPVNSARIRQIEASGAGFSIAIAAEQAMTFDVMARSDFGINLQLQGIDEIAMAEGSLAGLSVVETGGHHEVMVELNRQADFRVYRDQSAADHTLVIEATYKDGAERSGGENPAEVPAAPAAAGDAVAGAIAERQTAATASPASPVAAGAGDTGTIDDGVNSPVRTPRELSFEERDINNSRAAMQQIQRGQIVAAYEQLFNFLDGNPGAHRSRETLATLLFAQQEYAQAGAIVDQGLAMAPNYSAYKKIKARLLLLERRSQEAIELLRNVPPALAADPEYFELLASLYQQSGNYQDTVETYQALIRFDQNQPRWWVGMGVALEAMGNIDNAVSSYRAALQFEELEPSLRQYAQNRVRNLNRGN